MKKTVRALFILLLAAAIGYTLFNKDNTGIKTPASLPLTDTRVSAVNDAKLLWLVNADYGIDTGYTPPVVSAYRIIALSKSSIGLDDAVLEAVKALFDAAAERGFRDFYVSSGYRSYEEQAVIYEGSDDKSYVQPPGHSEHQTGLAADISYMDIGGEHLGNTWQGKWLAENAWKYGFILRYPKDKQKTTGISYEPWHFRYVGIAHAYYCYKNELCFEEYLEELKNGAGYSLDIPEQNSPLSYTVYYTSPVNGIINTPVGMDYEISGDNTGGYIVTVRER